MPSQPQHPGKLIAAARREKKLSQRELAEQLGVAYSTVANWERGTAYPRGLTRRAVAEYLAIDIPERAA